MPLMTLPLDPVVSVTVNLALSASPRRDFSLPLIIGVTTVISQNDRIKEYSNTDEMIQDGFLISDRLYKAAELLFGQHLRPSKILVGCVGTIDEDDGEGGTTTRAETPLEAIIACRKVNSNWYVGIYAGPASISDHLAIAQYCQSASVSSVYAYTTDDLNVLTTFSTGIFAQMKALKYRRTIGQFSTKNQDAVCAIIGWAMGAMAARPLEAYTLMFKQEVGVLPENADGVFTESSVTQITSDNGNIYINRGTYYDIFTNGRNADGTWFDELIFSDKIAYDMQLAVMDLFYQKKKIDQEETGVTEITDVLIRICEDLRAQNIIAPGVWNGGTVLALRDGVALPGGYMIQSLPVSSQSKADREARKTVPFVVCLNFAGAAHSATIMINIDR